MLDNHTPPQAQKITALTVTSAQSGVGLRWVLGVSLVAIVAVSVIVVGVNVASYSAI